MWTSLLPSVAKFFKMGSCEVRLNLISTTVSDQEEKVRKLERLQIELERRREVVGRMKEEEVGEHIVLLPYFCVLCI